MAEFRSQGSEDGRRNPEIAKTFYTFRMKMGLLGVLGVLSEASGSRSDL
jgi:hypothetical protein